MRLSPKYVSVQTEPTTTQKKTIGNEKAYKRKLDRHNGKQELMLNPDRVAEEEALAEMMGVLGMDDQDFDKQFAVVLG